jgi:hypothetical protein
VGGQGHGFIDVFNLDGTPGLPGGKERLVSRGPLDSPWGLALAPSSFGALSGDLLVGNFKSGLIDVFNPTTGKFLGNLNDPDGEPIQIDGLWALKVGNGGSGGDANTVYFTAGLDNETHGLFGSLTPVAPGTPEGAAEGQVVVAAADVVQIDLTTLNNDIASGASASTIAQDIQTLNTDIATLQSDEQVFVNDSSDDLGAAGTAGRRHKAVPGAHLADFGGSSSTALMPILSADIGNALGSVKKQRHDAHFDAAIKALRDG